MSRLGKLEGWWGVWVHRSADESILVAVMKEESDGLRWALRQYGPELRHGRPETVPARNWRVFEIKEDDLLPPETLAELADRTGTTVADLVLGEDAS